MLGRLPARGDGGESSKSVSKVVSDGRIFHFELEVRQQPKQARMCGTGEKADRRPVDPPPIVCLRARSERIAAGVPDAVPVAIHNKEFGPPTKTHQLFMFASLVTQNDDDELHLIPGTRTKHVAGSVVSSLYHLKDPSEAHTSSYFVFPDVGVRTEGIFRFKMSMYQITEDGVVLCGSIFTAPFQVYSAKRFPGMGQTTGLSKALSSQGFRLRVRRPKNSQADGGSDSDERAPAASPPHGTGRPIRPVMSSSQPAPRYEDPHMGMDYSKRASLPEKRLAPPEWEMGHSSAQRRRSDDTSVHGGGSDPWFRGMNDAYRVPLPREKLPPSHRPQMPPPPPVAPYRRPNEFMPAVAVARLRQKESLERMAPAYSPSNYSRQSLGDSRPSWSSSTSYGSTSSARMTAVRRDYDDRDRPPSPPRLPLPESSTRPQYPYTEKRSYSPPESNQRHSPPDASAQHAGSLAMLLQEDVIQDPSTKVSTDPHDFFAA